MSTREISVASLGHFAQERASRLHEHRKRAFDAAVQAYLRRGAGEAEQTLTRLWAADPAGSNEDGVAEYTCYLRALHWMSRERCLERRRTIACEPFTLERRLPTGETYAVTGRVDALAFEHGELLEWNSRDPLTSAVSAAYAVDRLRSPMLNVSWIELSAKSDRFVVTDVLSAGDLETKMCAIDRLAAQWIAHMDSQRPTLSISRTIDMSGQGAFGGNVFAGWGPRLR